MACGCKKKTQVPPQVARPVEQPANTGPMKVTIRENTSPRPPEPIPPAQSKTADQIIEKLNVILSPGAQQ